MVMIPRSVALAAALAFALSACGGKEQAQGGGMPPPEVGVEAQHQVGDVPRLVERQVPGLRDRF